MFLLLLCNDREVLDPWANSRLLNLFTGAVVAVLVMVSIILTASVFFPDMDEHWIIGESLQSSPPERPQQNARGTD